MITICTNLGDISLSLFSKEAPKTCQNFIELIHSGFYENTLFHRVIDGFMIQGGGFTPDMLHKSCDILLENEADNGLKNHMGTVAMARTANPHSASSQFFINVKDNHFLDHTEKTSEGWGYCVFAKVVDGMEVVDNIKQVETGSQAGHQNVPINDVVIHQIKITDSTD